MIRRSINKYLILIVLILLMAKVHYNSYFLEADQTFSSRKIAEFKGSKCIKGGITELSRPGFSMKT